MKTLTVACEACKATGLYCGFAEAPGTAVVCLRCNGTGKTTLQYQEFTGRKRRAGIHTIRRSRGSFILTGVGGIGPSMTYEEFEDQF